MPRDRLEQVRSFDCDKIFMFGLISKRVRKFKRNVIRLNCSATILWILKESFTKGSWFHFQQNISTLMPMKWI